MALKLGRLQLGNPSVMPVEPVGDPVTGAGGAVVSSARVPQQIQLQLNTVVTGATTLAQSQALRRQLRSMLNSSAMKLQAFLYVIYDDDPELNGWYVPDVSTIQSRDGTSFKAGLWETGATNFSLVGHQRTHREARQVWAKNLVTGLYQRDVLGWIYSKDFASSMTPIALAVFPPGASSVFSTVAWASLVPTALPTGSDGGVNSQVAGLADLTVMTYERTEANLNKGDVVVYDRRGGNDAPTGSAPGATWEEAYGPDYPWNWLTAGQPADTPVLENGLCRVLYDSTNNKGWRVYVWTGTVWAEQGKMVVRRLGTSTQFDVNWLGAWVREWTPERAVIGAQLSAAATDSRETVFITMARGTIGATFEVYPALDASGALADAQLVWQPALVTGAQASDATLVKAEQTAVVADNSTGGGSAWPAGTITQFGAADFSGTSTENWMAFLSNTGGATPAPGAYQTNFVVVQAAVRANTEGAATTAYGVADYLVAVGGTATTNLGYVQLSVAFAPTVSDQVGEAESIRNAGSGTTSQISDANASNGLAVQDTQTALTAATITKTSNLVQGRYRLLVRVRAGSSGTATFQGHLGANNSGQATTTSLTYVWLDLGDVDASVASPTFTVFAANGTVGGGAIVDCWRLVLAEDRTRSAAIYSGGRDAGASQLYDSRMLGALTAR